MAEASGGSLRTPWAVAYTATGLCGYIGIASFINGGSDRPAGLLLTLVAAVAAIALSRVRASAPAVIAATILGICVAQALAGFAMIAARLGTPWVIAALNAILMCVWLVGAGLFYAA